MDERFVGVDLTRVSAAMLDRALHSEDERVRRRAGREIDRRYALQKATRGRARRYRARRFLTGPAFWWACGVAVVLGVSWLIGGVL